MTFRIRILLDFLALGLLIACLAYWWLDNLAHEVIGTGFFALLILHNVFNRRWYGGPARGSRDAGRLANTLVISAMAVSMLVMLVTSLLVSRDLFAFARLDAASRIREIHMFTAYWALILVGAHLGTRWHVVMNIVRQTFGIARPNLARTWMLRLLAGVVMVKGVHAWAEMSVGSKLLWQYSMDMWDFNADTLGFFVSFLAVAGLAAGVSHYALKAIQALRQRGPRTAG